MTRTRLQPRALTHETAFDELEERGGLIADRLGIPHDAQNALVPMMESLDASVVRPGKRGELGGKCVRTDHEVMVADDRCRRAPQPGGQANRVTAAEMGSAIEVTAQ